ncbi:MAG: hypothetical protein AB8C84_10720 [Oligoflexales bacterium]
MIKAEYQAKFNLGDYKNAHAHEECKGDFEIYLVEKMPLSLNAIGYIQLPNVPMVSCKSCDAAYLLPRFEDFIDRAVAAKLLISPNVLSPREIKFLRLVTDSKQQEVANYIDCERSHYAKCESEKSATHRLSVGRQKLLKLFHAQKLGLMDKTIPNLTFLREETLSREELSRSVADEMQNFA